jgi:ABC-2 type transport system ATP-binding protein
MAVEPLDHNTVVRLDGVSVCYRAPNERVSTFKEYAIRWVQGRISHGLFWALNDINLEVHRGEAFGIVGHNGAGKSTLLKVIARVLRPTHGRVRVFGRVVPLLELGAGFHPELSGRENIILNGAIFGFTQTEMAKKVDRIIDFAELQKFIDAPMRTYSSGMWARLGFAVATDVEPDILILDEVLSVGDEAFQRKCLARIETFRQKQATILLVSHNTTLIEQICQNAVWLDHGVVKAVGDAKTVGELYRQNQANL